MQFVRELAQAGGLEPEDENEFAASILSEISSVKGERIALEHYYSKNCPDAVSVSSMQAMKRKCAGPDSSISMT